MSLGVLCSPTVFQQKYIPRNEGTLLNNPDINRSPLSLLERLTEPKLFFNMKLKRSESLGFSGWKHNYKSIKVKPTGSIYVVSELKHSYIVAEGKILFLPSGVWRRARVAAHDRLDPTSASASAVYFCRCISAVYSLSYGKYFIISRQ